MTRLHGALQRATEGKAQLVPPGDGIAAAQEAGPAQPGFSVPWTLDAEAPAAAGDAPAATVGEVPSTRRTGLPSARLKASLAIPSEVGEKLVTAEHSAAEVGLEVAIEQYRKLAAALHHAQGSRGLKLIMVTSANPGEGKSLTASNLALTLSESYQRRVLLIDADLRRPSLHIFFGVPNNTGLSDGLARASIEGLPVVELLPHLSVLPSGRPMQDPTSALTSVQMRQILEEARAGYDWAIIDTPPIGMLTDARLLGEMVDGVVIVVEAEKCPYPDVNRAVDIIGRERVLGAVLNRLRHVPGSTYYYKSYYRRSKAPTA
jgi:capsular exopolysaccharide synthesis family protein